MTLKISISGVRGFVPDALTPEVCLDFAKAFGTYLSGETAGRRTVVVGTDPRSSSEFIKGIVFSGLLSTGCRVVDLGIVPTPTVGLMVRELKADGGIVITASHNPLPWNGLKFMRRDGIFLNEVQAKKLIRLFEHKDFLSGAPGAVTSDQSGAARHIKRIIREIKPAAVRRRRYRVALDCCNGAGSAICRLLLNELGCKVEAINCRLDRPFPHDPEPVPKNLTELARLVKSRRADVGFALDSDADRLAIITDQGTPAGEELTLALAVKYALEQAPLTGGRRRLVVTNLSTTMAIDDVAKELDALVIRTKIGEVHVAEELKELKGLIGGEGNGGVIYPPVGYNRDALAGMAIILKLMATSRRTISELLTDIPHYYMIKEKLVCRDQRRAELFIDRVKAKFDRRDLILTEGVKAVLPGRWVHVRASNTEPIIRVIAEGKGRKEVKQLIKQVLKSGR